VYRIFIPAVSLALVSCVTETVSTTPSMKFDEASVVSVQDPGVHVVKGSTIAWSPETTQLYEDARINDKAIKELIEAEIESNLKKRDLSLVDSVSGSRYAIAYTAALESALDDEAIIRRFGLLPGHQQIPADDQNIEKGSLIIYLFNSQSGHIVWRSAAQTGVNMKADPDVRKEKVKRIVGEMFETFPQ
jgi:hypothetical protein